VPTNDYAETLRCHAPNISQQLYLWLSLFGYIIAYFLMTMFLTSYERIPVLNEIAFKSISVAFIKNMGKRDGMRNESVTNKKHALTTNRIASCHCLSPRRIYYQQKQDAGYSLYHYCTDNDLLQY
jgi:hypothetical protein